jgi:hypothetical protein
VVQLLVLWIQVSTVNEQLNLSFPKSPSDVSFPQDLSKVLLIIALPHKIHGQYGFMSLLDMRPKTIRAVEELAVFVTIRFALLYLAFSPKAEDVLAYTNCTRPPPNQHRREQL